MHTYINIIIGSIIIIIQASIGINFSYADGNKTNATLTYDQCNKFMNRQQTHIIQDFGDNICVFIEKNNGELLLLSKEVNSYGITLMSPDLIATLRSLYYRGEKVNIYYIGDTDTIDQTINITLSNTSYTTQTIKKGYTIEILSDSLLNSDNYGTLNTKCSFHSYNGTCENSQLTAINERIDTLLSELVITKQELQKASQDILKQEINKLQTISEKLSQLKQKYSSNEMLLFTLEYLIYKIEVNEQIMNNALEDLQFYAFLKENNIYFKDKSLLPDLYISQTDQFTFFYYKDTRINTLNTDLSHFDASEISADEKLEEDREYLKQEIRDKYSAEYIKGTGKQLILITKTYSNFNKYLLFDVRTLKLLSLDGKITQVEKGLKGHYFLTQNLADDQHLVLYDGKNNYNLLEEASGYVINSFELLSGGEVKIFYTSEDGEKLEETISVDEY